MRKIGTFIMVLAVFLTACDEDVETVYDVPEEYQPFVDKFLEEAGLRGFDYTIDNLIIKEDPQMEVGVCGSCNETTRRNDVQKVISINPSCYYDFPEQLESLIFHELGHCFLGRAHNSDLLSNGEPKSMMVVQHLYLYSPCVYQLGPETCDFRFKRTYYVDELFDESTPEPDWVNE